MTSLEYKISVAEFNLNEDIQACIDAHEFYPHARLAALYELVPELTDDQLVRYAAEYANNHSKFDSFAWFERPDDSQNWTIYYTHNRDSRLLAESNAAYIDSILMPYLDNDSPNIASAYASHWACGWIDGYAIRVYDASGQITPEFCVLAEILRQLDNYSILDENDYSNREFEATYENVKDALHMYTFDRDDMTETFDADSDEIASAVIRWLYDNRDNSLENVDDLGGYPSEEETIDALTALGYITPDYTDEELARLAEIALLKGTGDSGYTQLPLLPDSEN